MKEYIFVLEYNNNNKIYIYVEFSIERTLNKDCEQFFLSLIYFYSNQRI